MNTFDKLPLVYLASPYTQGDPGLNVHFQCKMFDELFDDGIVTPIVPLWSHIQHLITPRHYNEWMNYDFRIIARCDAVLRMRSVHKPLKYEQLWSPGANLECAHANDRDIPVFFTIDDLYQWAGARKHERSVATDG